VERGAAEARAEPVVWWIVHDPAATEWPRKPAARGPCAGFPPPLLGRARLPPQARHGFRVGGLRRAAAPPVASIAPSGAKTHRPKLLGTLGDPPGEASSPGAGRELLCGPSRDLARSSVVVMHQVV